MTDYYGEEEMIMEADKPLRMSPDGMRALRKATGLSLNEILGDEDEPERRMQAIAFGELHRRETRLGHMPDPGALWERAGRVLIVPTMQQPDPLGAASSTISPPSADSGA